MSTRSILVSALPEPFKNSLREARGYLITNTPLKNFVRKYDSELKFWKSAFKVRGGIFSNGHYERLMLGMTQGCTGEFLSGKIVADFGCGPGGSLAWADKALLRIGIDVLADRYADEFTDNIISHDMVYVKSTEKVIPLPSNFVDVLFTINSLDHVDNLHSMSNEIVRILKPGGMFIGSFNLEEPATPEEPQRLTEKLLKENLLSHLDIDSYRLSRKQHEGETYAPFFNGTECYKPGEEGFLWVRGKKPADQNSGDSRWTI